MFQLQLPRLNTLRVAPPEKRQHMSHHTLQCGQWPERYSKSRLNASADEARASFIPYQCQSWKFVLKQELPRAHLVEPTLFNIVINDIQSVETDKTYESQFVLMI